MIYEKSMSFLALSVVHGATHGQSVLVIAGAALPALVPVGNGGAQDVV